MASGIVQRAQASVKQWLSQPVSPRFAIQVIALTVLSATQPLFQPLLAQLLGVDLPFGTVPLLAMATGIPPGPGQPSEPPTPAAPPGDPGTVAPTGGEGATAGPEDLGETKRVGGAVDTVKEGGNDP